MSTPPASQVEVKKKGLHPLAWVGIGCGALVVIAGIVLVVGMFFVAQKVKEVGADFEKNPALAAARVAVKLNPELEEVNVDEEAGTYTVRNTRTGEVFTVDFADIENGKVSFRADGREMVIETDQDSGAVRVTGEGGGEDESFALEFGDKGSGEAPDWLPAYPGGTQEGGYTMTADERTSGGLRVLTADPVEKVVEHYRSGLADAGFAVQVNTFSTDDNATAGMVTGTDEPGKRQVQVMVAREGEGEEATTTATITYTVGKE